MSASYFGTFPVKIPLGSYVDQNGIKYSNLKIIDKIDSYSSQVPSVGSEFELDTSLWVTDADVSVLQNGLAEIMVKAAGPGPNASTRVRLIPGGPRIWGLAGEEDTTYTQNDFVIPRFSNNGGVAVNVSFVETAGNEASIIYTYSQKIMPANINGIALPEALGSPNTTSFSPNIPGQLPRISETYRGFICSEISTQTFGSAMLVNLYFRESGFMFSGNTKLYEF
ncbi:hypothetical protein EBZ39_06960 [bacterium]|nr:hypothetical protein [bacterium]